MSGQFEAYSLSEVTESSYFLALARMLGEKCLLRFYGWRHRAQSPPGLGRAPCPVQGWHPLPPQSSPHLVHMIDDSRLSSDQMRAVQSPTVRKFFG